MVSGSRTFLGLGLLSAPLPAGGNPSSSYRGGAKSDSVWLQKGNVPTNRAIEWMKDRGPLVSRNTVIGCWYSGFPVREMGWKITGLKHSSISFWDSEWLSGDPVNFLNYPQHFSLPCNVVKKYCFLVFGGRYSRAWAFHHQGTKYDSLGLQWDCSGDAAST